jgi:hypothetical protein
MKGDMVSMTTLETTYIPPQIAAAERPEINP